MNTLLSFGSWLKLRRRAMNYTQCELARRVYCAEITIRKIEADDLIPGCDLLELILRALNVKSTEWSDLVRLARRREVEFNHFGQRVSSGSSWM
ncbi:MAG: XRE family transcriptional regulator [Chloroflexota bacterium]|nr:MAG: XRE family transcriptional regulator [Chloroflexota bacterium]